MSNADYYKIHWLTFSKVRLTFGYNGNINKSATAVATARQDNGARLTGLDYAYILNPGNPNLRWEKVQKINVGYDFSIKNNLILEALIFMPKRELIYLEKKKTSCLLLLQVILNFLETLQAQQVMGLTSNLLPTIFACEIFAGRPPCS